MWFFFSSWMQVCVIAFFRQAHHYITSMESEHVVITNVIRKQAWHGENSDMYRECILTSDLYRECVLLCICGVCRKLLQHASGIIFDVSHQMISLRSWRTCYKKSYISVFDTEFLTARRTSFEVLIHWCSFVGVYKYVCARVYLNGAGYANVW